MKRFIIWLAAILLPLLFLFYWKQQNKIYPTNDEAFYFTVTQEMYMNFGLDDLSKAFTELYLHKHWKPILHPVLGVPFLFLSNGDVRLAVSLYTAFFYILLLTFCYLYLSRYLEKTAAVVGTNLIAFIPWIFGITTNFTSESAFLTTVVAFFYFAHDLEDFKPIKKVLYAALSLCLMVCLRPIEAGLIFTIPVLLYIRQGYKKNEINVFDLAILIIWISYFFSVIIPPYFILKSNYAHEVLILIDSFCILFFSAVLFSRKKLSLNYGFQLFIGLLFGITIIWYASGARELFDWIIIANFDTLAIETGHRYGRPISEFLYFYISKLGLVPVLLASLIFLNVQQNVKSYFNSRTIVLFLSIFILPLIAGSLSYNGDVRYYYGTWLIACLVLIKVILNAELKYYLIRLYSVSALAALLYLNLLNINIGISTALVNKASAALGQSFFKVNYNKNEYAVAAEDQLENIIGHSTTSPKIYMIHRNSESYWIDPWTLMIIAREKNLFWEIRDLDLFINTPREEITTEIAKSFNYVVAGPIQESWTQYKTGISELGSEFTSACVNENSSRLNFGKFELIGRFIVNMTATNTGTYCVFKNEQAVEIKEKRFH